METRDYWYGDLSPCNSNISNVNNSQPEAIIGGLCRREQSYS